MEPSLRSLIGLSKVLFLLLLLSIAIFMHIICCILANLSPSLVFIIASELQDSADMAWWLKEMVIQSNMVMVHEIRLG